MSSREELKRKEIPSEKSRHFILYLETFTALAFSCFFVLSQPTHSFCFLSGSSISFYLLNASLPISLSLNLWTVSGEEEMSFFDSKIMNWKSLPVATNGNGHRSHRPLTAPDTLGDSNIWRRDLLANQKGLNFKCCFSLIFDPSGLTSELKADGCM